MGITHGRGEGGAGKSIDRLLGNESLCQTKPQNLVISQLGRGEFQVSSEHGRVKRKGKGGDGGRWCVQAVLRE